MCNTYDYMDMSYPDALVSGHAICVHYSMAAYILLNAEGIPTRMVAGTRSGGGHQWNECFIDGTWVTVDLCQRIIWKPILKFREG